MCRWLAYSGGEIPLAELIFNTRHSLIDQSLAAKSGPQTTNGDGFGVGWYDTLDTPGLYKNMQPAWNDVNLHDLCTHVSSPLFIAHIRASTGTAIQYTNCHPFRSGQCLFVHNGVIREFSRVRRRLVHELNDDYFREIAGSTDSELMFLLALPDFNVALRKNPGGRLFPGILKVLWAARKIKRLRILLLGVELEHRRSGIDALMILWIWKKAVKSGYEWSEAGWVLEDNHPMNNNLERLEFERYKTLRLYERPI